LFRGAAFVDAAHEAGMYVLPDDVAEIKKASQWQMHRRRS